MTTLFNKTVQKGTSRYLRNHMTRAEIVLWYQLKGKQVHGFKFRRQYGVGRYIVDFYCPKLHLAIEVDGLSHSTAEARENDRQRQTDIERYGFRFLRFTDEQVLNRGDEVVQKILFLNFQV